MSHYDTLGVKKDATQEEIKRAYRRRAQRAHPDKPGGSQEQFLAVKKGYEVLSSPERRAQYDKTGGDGSAIDQTPTEAMQELARLFLSAVENLDVDKHDLIKRCREKVRSFEVKRVSDAAVIRRGIDKLERTLKRLKRKKKGQDFIVAVVVNAIDKHRTALTELERVKERHRIMEELLDEYEYRFDEEPASSQLDAIIRQVLG